jgi:hypothetical protein
LPEIEAQAMCVPAAPDGQILGRRNLLAEQTCFPMRAYADEEHEGVQAWTEGESMGAQARGHSGTMLSCRSLDSHTRTLAAIFPQPRTLADPGSCLDLIPKMTSDQDDGRS